MNWWELLKQYSVDDDWEDFDPMVHDVEDYLAGVEGPHISPYEDIEEASTGDIIEDALRTEEESRGQGGTGTGPSRGPGDWRRPRGQTIRAPPSLAEVRRGRGSGSEPSRGYIRPRNRPFIDEYGVQKPFKRQEWTPELDEAMQVLVNHLRQQESEDEEDIGIGQRHPGSLMTESDLADKYHGSPIHLDNSDEFANLADLLMEDGPIHDLAGVMPSGEIYPVEFQDVAAELHGDPDAPEPPWSVDAIEEAIRSGKVTPDELELFIHPEQPERPTTRSSVGLDPMTAMEIGLPGPWGEGDTDTPTAERRVHIDRDPQVHEIMETIEDHPDDFDMERIMELSLIHI